jgi:hypothetical protein
MNRPMKTVNNLVLLLTFALLSSLCALARDKAQHSIDLPDSVQVGSTHLKAGNYKVQWQGAGPSVEVAFLQNGKTVATATAKLKPTDHKVAQDDIIVSNTTDTKALQEIDFARPNQALVFGGM